jgi:hypothetical protein
MSLPKIGLARTIYKHRIWPYIWWFPCQKYRIYTVYIGFWPTLRMCFCACRCSSLHTSGCLGGGVGKKRACKTCYCHPTTPSWSGCPLWWVCCHCMLRFIKCSSVCVCVCLCVCVCVSYAVCCMLCVHLCFYHQRLRSFPSLALTHSFCCQIGLPRRLCQVQFYNFQSLCSLHLISYSFSFSPWHTCQVARWSCLKHRPLLFLFRSCRRRRGERQGGSLRFSQVTVYTHWNVA